METRSDGYSHAAMNINELVIVVIGVHNKLSHDVRAPYVARNILPS